MSITPVQHTQLLRPINPKRVGKDGKGHSHVEAYDIRAHLNRIFGFCGWSADTVVMEMVFEASEERVNKNTKDTYNAWTVCYRAQLRLTIINDEGFSEATYTEWATGDATNQPSRADAHDLALKTAESQALKRAAANLGDQFGLSLYAKGSTSAIVGKTLVGPEVVEVDAPPVDAHVTEQVIPEAAAVAEVRPDPRTSNGPQRVGTDPKIAELQARANAIANRGKAS